MVLQSHTSQQYFKKYIENTFLNTRHHPPTKNKKVLLNNKKSPMIYSYIFFRNSTSYSNNIHHLSNEWFRNLSSITSKFFPWSFHKFFMRFLQKIFRKIFKKTSGEFLWDFFKFFQGFLKKFLQSLLQFLPKKCPWSLFGFIAKVDFWISCVRI